MRVLVLALLLAACRPPGYGKGDDTGDDQTGDDNAGDDNGNAVDAAVTTDAPSTSTCTKAFHLDGHSAATTVVVTGTFANWAATPPDAIALAKVASGAWEGSHEFAAGSYQYKYVIDGSEWILDPTNANTVDDGMGHQNSAFTCTPAL
jgi:hypothetical protein